MINLDNMMREFNECYDYQFTGINMEIIESEIKEAKAEKSGTIDHAKECADVVYAASQQLYSAISNSDDILSSLTSNDKIIDVVTIATTYTNYMSIIGYDFEAIMTEVHRSNMSKTVKLYDLDFEIAVARSRYPGITTKKVGDAYVMYCADTNKVIKPTSYSPAVITEAMLCKS